MILYSNTIVITGTQTSTQTNLIALDVALEWRKCSVAVLRHNELIDDTPVLVRHLLVEQRACIVDNDAPVAELQRLLARGVDAVAGNVADTMAVFDPRVERRRPGIASGNVQRRVRVMEIMLRCATSCEPIARGGAASGDSGSGKHLTDRV